MRAAVRFARMGSTGVIEAGRLVGKPAGFPPRVFPAWCLVLVTAGGGTCRWPSGRAAVAAGDLLIVVPGERHAYGPDAGLTWNETFISASGPLADAIGRQLILPACDGRVRRACPPGLRAALERIADRFLAGGEDAAGALLAELHLAWAAAASTAPAEAWIDRAQRLLAADPARTIAPAAVARAVGQPYRRFRAGFRAATGLSPRDFRLHCRLAEARRMLVESPAAPLAEIAAATGFCSPFQLSRIYKARLGRPPSADRQSGR